MIFIYTGTPGSGKSYRQAECIYYSLRRGLPVIANYRINTSAIKNCRGEFIYLDNSELSPVFLRQYSRDYFSSHRFKEGRISLYIDECQIIFNCRDWGKKDRSGWIEFFTQHRKYGYDIILIAQSDSMVDKQLRALIEYQYILRKVTNYGWKGKLLSFLSGGNLCVAVKVWYPMKEKVGAEFFHIRKKFFRLYDSYLDFNENSSVAAQEQKTDFTDLTSQFLPENEAAAVPIGPAAMQNI